MCGDQVAAIGLVLAAAGRHSAVLVAVMFVVELLPGVVLGTWIGRRVDGLAVRRAWVGGLAPRRSASAWRPPWAACGLRPPCWR
ncbi:MAG: hypothetical protein M0T80_00655 [Actinomycetota bacterium]|nr:hypothetical protein [Actinomycetota bacterium]